MKNRANVKKNIKKILISFKKHNIFEDMPIFESFKKN